MNKGILAINGGTPVRLNPMPKRNLFDKAEKDAVIKVMDESINSGDLFRYGGKYEREYISRFINFMGKKGFADGVNSGTNAFFSALGALDLSPGSEVIVPAITDVGGVSPVFFHSLIPVMADVDQRSYNTCAEEIKPLITSKTKAIVVAHVAGDPVDINPIITLANQYSLKVIEDCSQSHGAELEGKKVGTFGDISFFSTMSSKHHCTGGQGGVVFSNSEDLIIKSSMISDRGKVYHKEKFSGNSIVAGLNCNMDELSAAIGCVQIQKLPNIIDSTNYIGELIKTELSKSSVVSSVGWQPKNTKCVYWFIRLKLDLSKISVDKKRFSDALAAEGILVSNEYRYTPFSQLWYKKALHSSCAISNSRRQEILKQMKYTNVEKVLSEHINIFIREKNRNKF